MSKTTVTKKQLKKFVNENGFFRSMTLVTEKNAPADIAAQVPEGATYFEGVASTGDKNRNGYIIRPAAWIPAIAEFMKNPIVLLQHEAENPIGQCLTAEVVGNELRVSGYIFDDMTNGAFGRNLLKALSTGHITEEVEFENEETGEVISEEDYIARREKGEIGWGDTPWVLAVTKLQWVEFSLVAIGSNRSSFVTKKNAIEAFLKTGKLSENSLKPYAKNEGDEDTEDEQTKDEGGEDAADEKAGETAGEGEQPAPAATDSGEPSGEGSGESSETAGESPAASEIDGENSGGEPADETETKTEGETETSTETDEKGGEGENKIVISPKDRARLEAAAAELQTLLAATIASNEGEDDGKGDEKGAGEGTAGDSEGEQPAGEKPADAKPADETAEVTKSGEEQVAGVSKSTIDALPKEVRTLLHDLGKTVIDKNAKIEQLEAEITGLKAKQVNRKVLAVAQFGSQDEKDAGQKDEGKNESKKTDAKAGSLVNWFRANGARI